MGIYTPGRRRAIALLLLTSILLLTIDLRGNEILDATRNGFDKVLQPFETAAEVVSRPVQNAWRGINDYERLDEENQRLQEQIDAQTADLVTAQAVIIEINKGSNDGIQVGMAVLTTAGLVGKVTAPVEPDRARIMLVTDSRFSVDVKLVPAAPPPETTTTTTTPPTSTTLTPPAAVPGATPTGSSSTTTPAAPDNGSSTTAAAPTTAPGETTTTTSTTVAAAAPEVATTTTIDVDLVRETGGFAGQGEGELPAVVYLDNTPSLGRFEVGDLVFTSGSHDSLAPANIPVGRVVNVIERTTSQGPMLQIEPFANLDSLYFVRVVLYQPGVEVGAGDAAGD
ncbi:MAG: rod shape-determining protein MreC [Acidimicrobiia bacterium]|nr:rod shape-determining protein MreC [Acidimicrobiia bacterium]